MVKIGSKLSGEQFISAGVPQESILGPLIFSIYINEIFSICKDVTIHGYADDIQIYISRRIGLKEDLCARLNEDLERISAWAEINKLKINPLKSSVLPIAKHDVDVEGLQEITVNNLPLKFVSKTRNLGFLINSKLSCTDHINNVVSKVYAILRVLRMSSDFTPLEVRKKMALQLIMPIISYAATVYCKPDSVSMHKLQVSFNHTVRYVYGLQRFDHIRQWSKSLLGVNLVDYFAVKNCLFLYNLIETQEPTYLFEKLIFCRSNRSRLLLIPEYNYLNSTRLFFISAIRTWNDLPNRIKSACDRSNFKREIMEHYRGI